MELQEEQGQLILLFEEAYVYPTVYQNIKMKNIQYSIG